MKKIIFFLTLLIAISIPQRAQTQNVNWVGLQSETTTITTSGQMVVVTLNGSLNVPISRAALSLRYDPACFRVTSHHPGDLLTGAVILAQAKPGQFDLAYHFENNLQGRTGQGSLINIQLESIKLCDSDLAVVPNSIVLGVLDAKGALVNLPNVEYRSLILHLALGQAPVATKSAVLSNTPALLQLPNAFNTTLFFLLLILLPIMGGIVYFLLFKHSSKSRKLVSGAGLANTTTMLIHAGRSINLVQKRTAIGRHVEITRRDDGFYLADIANRKRTFLNGNSLGPGPQLLHDGDEFRVGRGVPYRFVKSKKAGS